MAHCCLSPFHHQNTRGAVLISAESKPLLTIVTVTYNDPAGLTDTLSSLEDLRISAGDHIEVIVQNGGSEVSLGVVRHEFPWARLTSEPDKGIYDAMNKGVGQARGTYVWFLNGGDRSLVKNWSVLQGLLLPQQERIILAGYVLNFGPRSVRRTSRPVSYIWHGLPTSHQAIIYPAAPVKRLEYDTSYAITGDYALTASLISGGVKAVRSGIELAVFNAGGTSQQHARQIAVEAARVQREILAVPLHRRVISSARHLVSRLLRSLSTRGRRGV